MSVEHWKSLNGLSDAVVTATSNIGLGTGAVDAITTGDRNVGLGDNNLTACTSGSNNTAVGHEALGGNTTASNNVAFGYQALLSNTTGAYNVVLGNQAQYTSTGSERNTAIGHNSLKASTASYNTATIYGETGSALPKLRTHMSSAAYETQLTGSYNFSNIHVAKLDISEGGRYVKAYMDGTLFATHDAQSSSPSHRVPQGQENFFLYLNMSS